METARKYGRWGWWAIIGLVAILILIGLIIAAIASRNMKTAETETSTASVVETTQDATKEGNATVESEDKSETKTEEKTDSSEKKKSTSSTGSTSTAKKKEEPAVVTRCKSKAYMEKTLNGSTNLDCNSEAGIAEFKKSEGSAGSTSSTTTTPNSSAGPEVYDSSSLPKSGPEDLLPVFVLVALGAYVGLSAMGVRKKVDAGIKVG